MLQCKEKKKREQNKIDAFHPSSLGELHVELLDWNTKGSK